MDEFRTSAIRLTCVLIALKTDTSSRLPCYFTTKMPIVDEVKILDYEHIAPAAMRRRRLVSRAAPHDGVASAHAGVTLSPTHRPPVSPAGAAVAARMAREAMDGIQTPLREA
eukprot:6211162-Pleurochrysis_carterae.AAC.1